MPCVSPRVGSHRARETRIHVSAHRNDLYQQSKGDCAAEQLLFDTLPSAGAGNSYLVRTTSRRRLDRYLTKNTRSGSLVRRMHPETKTNLWRWKVQNEREDWRA